MRLFILSALISFSASAMAQDKKLLEKQMLEIMMDYPHAFSNLKTDEHSIFLKFRISGTGDAMVLGKGKDTYITTMLGFPKSEAEAKSLFDKWVALIGSITLNGAQLAPDNCKPAKDELYCRQWKIDNARHNIDPLYLPFTIMVEVVKVMNTYGASLKIGTF
jgi:hypothetical protein